MTVDPIGAAATTRFASLRVASALQYNRVVDERRRAPRQPFAWPVNICTDTRKDRAGMARDASAGGILFRSRSKFAIGERVVLTFHVANDVTNATGRVVRAWTEMEPTVFPHATAVEFDEPLLAFVA